MRAQTGLFGEQQYRPRVLELLGHGRGYVLHPCELRNDSKRSVFARDLLHKQRQHIPTTTRASPDDGISSLDCASTDGLNAPLMGVSTNASSNSSIRTLDSRATSE
ncbi:MAG: hypothetical protein ACI9W2_004893, partial [Gammaproteobacteria bacterium]